ncbi:zincin-like metallopeptidase domain-containing protein [Pasteurella multocida]
MEDTTKKPFYKEVAEKLIDQLEKGVAPWQRGWGTIGTPYNLSTGKSYRGANVLNLSLSGYGDPRWMTYKQAQEMGAQVRRGEKGSKVQYWIFEEMRAILDKDGNPKLDHNGKELLEKVRLERPKVINSVVFNAEQIDGLPPLQVKQRNTWEIIEKAENILTNSGANIIHKRQDRAYYQESTDRIVLPEKDQFQAPEFYYGTALHELGHWTGHSTRLNRDLGGVFGSEQYAREELRAEISSMMLEMEIGIPHDTDRHASYVQSWVKVLKDEPAEIIRAASDAEKIKDFVLSLSLEQNLDLKKEQIFELSEIKIGYSEIGGRDTSLKTLGELQEWFVGAISEEEINRNNGYAKVSVEFIGKSQNGEETSMIDRIDVGKNKHDFNPYEQNIAEYIKNKLTYYKITSPELSNELGADNANLVSQAEHIMEKTYISVPFKEKEQAKKLGAKWDRKESSWYIPEDLDKSLFTRWLNTKDSENSISEMLRSKLDDMDEYFSHQAGLNGVTYMSADGTYITAANVPDGLNITINKGENNNYTFNFSNSFGANEVEYKRDINQHNMTQTIEEFEKNLNEFISLTREFKHDKSLLKEKTEKLSFDEVVFANTNKAYSESIVDSDKIYLAVPFTDKDEAKKLGAKWDKVAKSWYVEGNVPSELKKWLPDNSPIQQDPALSPREEFANFMRDMGLVVSGEHPIMDGKLHRVRTESDKSKELSGAYILHGDGLPAGYAQNFRTGEKLNWKSKGYHISPEEIAKMRAESAQKLQEREAEIANKHEEISIQLTKNNNSLAKVNSDQAYLLKKGIQAHQGVFEDKYRNMVIPAYDETGKVWANQTIYPDGNKRFTAGGKKEGNFHVIGGLEQLSHTNVIIIAEGYATAATITEATNIPVIAAFDSGNLKTVADKLHKKYPDKPIIIAGDDDAHRELENKPNVGRSKAEEAAKHVNGVAVFPIFPSDKIGSKSCTDFNDLARESDYKLNAVSNIIQPHVDNLLKRKVNTQKQQSTTTKIKR